MTTVSAGDPVTAAYLNGLGVVVDDATPGTVATNFTVSAVLARTLVGGKFVYIKLEIITTNALTATSNNISDVTIYTVDTAYRPTERINSVFSANPGTGEAMLNSDGTVVLRTADATISAGSTLVVSFQFIKD